MKNLAKQLLVLTATALPVALHAAVPLKWTVETSRVQPVVFDAVRGETLALEAAFNSYGTPLELGENGENGESGTGYSLFYQTNGMGSAWWALPATVESNRVSAVFAATNDPGASAVHGFIGTTGRMYRAAFTLRFRHGPGANPSVVQFPRRSLDFATVEISNAPFYTKAESEARIIAATNPLCSVAAAAAMTNALAALIGEGTSDALQSHFDYEGNCIYWGSDGKLKTGATTQLELGGSISGGGDIKADYGWFQFCAGSQNLPAYLASCAWAGSNKCLTDYGITNAVSGGGRSDAEIYALVESWASENEMVDKADVISATNTVFVEATNAVWANGVNVANKAASAAMLWPDAATDNGKMTWSAAQGKWLVSDAATATADPVATSNYVASVAYPKTDGEAWATYWDGDEVRVTITNYFGATDLPHLYIEQRTNETGTAKYKTVWDETTRWEKFLGTNWLWTGWAGAYSFRTNVLAELDEKADRAWGFYDSHTGTLAPADYTTISASNLMIAAGLAYQRTITAGGCAVWVLTCTEPTTVSGLTNGTFQVKDADGNVQVELVKGDKRTVGARCGGVSVSGSTLTANYAVASAEHPTAEVSANLSNWFAETSASCPATVSWSGSSGAWRATITPKSASATKIFVKATYEAGGEDLLYSHVAVKFPKIVIGSTTYTIGTATISGNTVLTLTAE